VSANIANYFLIPISFRDMELATKRNGARDIHKNKGPSMSRIAKTADAQENVREIDDCDGT